MTKIWVEVAYALPDKQYVIPVELTLGDVRDGDRVEIYRPLIADPKEMRRKRAEKARQKTE